MADYIGVIKFDDAIPCKKEISGKCIQTKIAGKSVRLIFPSLPEEYDFEEVDLENGDLTVPNNLFKGRVDWGTVNKWPEGLFSVNAVICYLSGTLDEVDRIYQEFPKWRERVARLQLINTGDYLIPEQKIPAIVRGAGFDDGLQLFTFERGKPLEYIMNGRTINSIQLKFVNAEETYSLKELQDLFFNAGEDREISLSYELLITAYHAICRNDYRSAVILAGSAIEHAVIRRMRQAYDSIDEYNSDLKRYRMLGGKFRWLNEKQINIPVSDYKKDILDIRNAVVHEGRMPTYKEAKVCVSKTKKLVKTYDRDVLE